MENAVRVERYIWMARSSSCFPTNKYTMYFKLPSDIKHELRERYGIDLAKNWKKTLVEAILAEESSDGGKEKELTIVYKLRVLPGVK